MRKQMFFLLSSMLLSMNIMGMENKQQSTLEILPEELVYKLVQWFDLQEIGRFKQTCKKYSNDSYNIITLMCPSHKTFSINHQCGFLISKQIQNSSSNRLRVVREYFLSRSHGDQNMMTWMLINKLGSMIQVKKHSEGQQQIDAYHLGNNEEWIVKIKHITTYVGIITFISVLAIGIKKLL